MKQHLVDADGQHCPYCGRKMVRGDPKLMPTDDHITPRKGKKRRAGDRTIVTCSECNFMKKDLTLIEYAVELQLKSQELEKFIELNDERVRNIMYLLSIGLEE